MGWGRDRCKEIYTFSEGGPLTNFLGKKEHIAVAPDETVSRSDYLLDVAAETFLQLGFEGTSVGEIARRAHASKETLYSKFTNKNELFRRVMGRLMDRFASRLSSTLSTEGPPEAVLASFADLVLERILSDEGIGLQKIIYMESSRFPEVAKVFFEFGPQRTAKAMADYFNAQVKKGVMREMDAALAAGHFIGLLTSDLMMRKSLGMLTQPSSEEKAYRIKSAVAVFLRAYGAKS
jgi:TetR/AcrR family transcriptional repressor of mexJK operon